MRLSFSSCSGGNNRSSACARMTGNLQQGEDLKQETFTRIFVRRKDFRQGCKFSTWLWRIALNLCYDNCAGGSGMASFPSRMERMRPVRRGNRRPTSLLPMHGWPRGKSATWCVAPCCASRKRTAPFWCCATVKGLSCGKLPTYLKSRKRPPVRALPSAGPNHPVARTSI